MARAHRGGMGNGELVVLCGSAHPTLGPAIARELGSTPARCSVERFPDGEMHVEVDAAAVEGCDVAIVQPTSHVASDHLLELLFVADAARRSGATRISAVVPYFGYARQDRRKKPGEALGVHVVADVLGAAGLERLYTVDPHSDAVEASLDVPMDRVSAVPLLAEALSQHAEKNGLVVVAPDLGAVRLARQYASLLRARLAVVHKVRTSGTDVEVERVAGDVRGLHPILVDDMIATGGTIVAAARALAGEGAQRGFVVAATHAVLTTGAMDRLREAGLRHLVVTDTIAPRETEPQTTVVSVASLLAARLRRGS